MKMIKRTFALVLLLSLLLSLTGCNWLDEMRQQQAFFDAGKIVYNGITYQLLPESDTLYPELDYSHYIYPTTPDVPVLLSTIIANEWFYLSKDAAFLVGSNDSIYCRQDMHAQISQRIREGFTPEVICYFYDVWDEKDYDYTEQAYILTDSQIEMLELVCSTVEPQSMNEGMSLDYHWSILLYECSADLLFQRTSSLRIAGVGRVYYLLLETAEGNKAFRVPDGCNAELDALTEYYFDDYEKPLPAFNGSI